LHQLCGHLLLFQIVIYCFFEAFEVGTLNEPGSLSGHAGHQDLAGVLILPLDQVDGLVIVELSSEATRIRYAHILYMGERI
jgi:hypothetical protein